MLSIKIEVFVRLIRVPIKPHYLTVKIIVRVSSVSQMQEARASKI